ncbi:MAG: protein TolQ [Caulobacterales bacterium]
MEAAATAAHDMSVWGLFLKADFIVKTVMVILAFCSVWSWAVAIDKWLQFGDIASRAAAFEKKFWSGSSMEDLEEARSDGKNDVMARVFAAAAREWRDMRRAGGLLPAQVGLFQERCDRLMQAAIQRETAQAGKGLAVLASIGSSAPFIGLFGTVWGIMNAFTAIAAAKETNLAVVAPGIAEALFATALGLAAAIPAVIFYNKFSGDLDALADRLEGFSDEFSARISRRIAERAV